MEKGGAKGKKLNSCMQKIAAKADIFGLVRDIRNIFRAMVAYERRWYHYWARYFGSVDKNPVIKLSLKVWMNLSAALR